MINEILVNSSVLSQIIVLLIISGKVIRSGWKSGPVILRLFFVFGLIALVLSDLYYITHIWLKDTPYLPFSAEDVSSAGMYLLFSASVRSLYYEEINHGRKIPVWGLLFGLFNMVLWVLWSGNIWRSIVSGAAFVYLTCSMVWLAQRTRLFSKAERWGIMGLSLFVFPAEMVLYYLPEGGAKTALDVTCYGVLYLVLIYLIVLTIHGLLERWDPDRLIAVSGFSFTWALCAIYLSEEPVYSIGDFLVTASLILMYYAVERKRLQT